MATWSKRQLRDRVAFFRRNLVNHGWATEEEVDSVAQSFPGATKDDLWQQLAMLMTYGRRGEWKGARSKETEARADELDVALSALEDRPETVELPSVNDGDGPMRVTVRPGNWARLNRIDDCDFWRWRLEAARIYLRQEIEAGRDVDEFDDWTRRIEEELNWTRAMIYAHATAPGTEPWKEPEPPAWCYKLTPVEELMLIQAYHRVNLEPMTLMPKPRGRDGKSELPRHWAFLLQSVSWREKRPVREVIHDRSLVSIVAEATLEGIRNPPKPQPKPKLPRRRRR